MKPETKTSLKQFLETQETDLKKERCEVVTQLRFKQKTLKGLKQELSASNRVYGFIEKSQLNTSIRIQTNSSVKECAKNIAHVRNEVKTLEKRRQDLKEKIKQFRNVREEAFPYKKK